MKTSKIIMIIAFIIILLSITSFIVFLRLNFEKDCIEGNGAVVTKEFQLQHFKGIAVNNAVQVEITQDSIQSVKISSDENIIESMDLTVKDEMLNIGRKKCIKGMNHIIINISMDTLTKIELNSGGRIKSTDTIRGNSLEAHLYSGGNLEMSMVYAQLNCTLSAGAQAWFVGKADNMNAELSSGSNLSTSELKVGNCKIDAGSGANAKIKVSGELTAEANSGGTIRYIGTPSKLNINTNTGGTVSKEE